VLVQYSRVLYSLSSIHSRFSAIQRKLVQQLDHEQEPSHHPLNLQMAHVIIVSMRCAGGNAVLPGSDDFH
jgi:hypothetical protein